MSAAASGRATRLRAFLEAEARAIGFDTIGVTGPDTIPQAPKRLQVFLANGHHGSMDWLESRADERGDPQTLWRDVRSVIMLGMNYGPDSDPRAILPRKDRAAISVYAQNRDYHDVVKGKLKMLAGKFAARAGADVKVFVDTAPVMEKPLAGQAGLGWQGKHTNLVSRGFGSWLFLGSIFTTADLERNTAVIDHCGRCTACQDACPTAAFPAPYRLDARRCISYLTIENKEPIPHEFRKALGNRIYGYDDCLAACPWNKFAQIAREAKFTARDELRAPRLGHLLTLDDPAFRALFSGSPIKRIGRDRFLRNVLVAAGNSGDHALIAPCKALLDDPNPLVRGAAVWALSQLLPAADFQALAQQQRGEPDKTVRDEWEMAGSAMEIG